MSTQAGYTLMELAILIVVIAIVAVAVSSQMPAKEPFQVDGFSNVFLQDLRLTQTLSMGKNQRYRIVVGAGSYQIQNQSGTPFNNPETGGSTTLYPSGLTISPATTVIFDSIGRPYNGGGTALSSVSTFTVSAPGSVKSVSVTPQTGFIQ